MSLDGPARVRYHSRSARRARACVRPPRSTPTTPVCATPVCTSMPRERRWAASAAVWAWAGAAATRRMATGSRSTGGRKRSSPLNSGVAPGRGMWGEKTPGIYGVVKPATTIFPPLGQPRADRGSVSLRAGARAWRSPSGWRAPRRQVRSGALPATGRVAGNALPNRKRGCRRARVVPGGCRAPIS
jgi:hypothetical protein